MKLYVVQMERCQDDIKLYQRQIERDLLHMKRESGQIKREEQQVERVFPCLMFCGLIPLFHPVRIDCREGVLAALCCLIECKDKQLCRDVKPFCLDFFRGGGKVLWS